MVDVDINCGFSIDTYVRRIERAGANVNNVNYHENLGTYSIDFILGIDSGRAISGRGEILGSVAEVDECGGLEVAVLRFPTIRINGNLEELTGKIKDVLVEAIIEVIDIDFRFGVIQDDNI